MSSHTGTGSLSGLRVLDLSRILAGPYAAMNLADLGADVIKVESPGRGDETRFWGPPFEPRTGTASYFFSVNRNKRSLTLDLAQPRGREIAQRLASASDVVIDNFLPGKLEQFGLDRATLEAVNPGVITATISGFGRDNAYAGRPGFDFLAQAMGGMMSVTGAVGGEPTRVGVAISDLFAGLHVTCGVLAALHERARTGVGTHVEVALLDAQVAMLVNLASGHLLGGAVPTRFGNRHPSIAPYETLQTADEQIAVAVGTDRQFSLFAAALDASWLAIDPRFATNAGRVTHRGDLVRELESRLAIAGRQHWLEVLVAAGVPVAPVNDLAEVFADPVVRQRMVLELDGVEQVGSPLRMNGRQPALRSSPPRLGADTETILDELGYGRDLDLLRREGVIG